MNVKKHDLYEDLIIGIYTADGSSMKVTVEPSQNVHEVITKIINHEGAYKFTLKNLDPLKRNEERMKRDKSVVVSKNSASINREDSDNESDDDTNYTDATKSDKNNK